MGRKNVVSGFTIFNAVDATATQNQNDTSASIAASGNGGTIIDSADKVSIHCKFSTNNTGEFFLYANNSDDQSRWYKLEFDEAMTMTAETECQILLLECPFKRIYLQWVPSAGAGTLTAQLSAKVVGA